MRKSRIASQEEKEMLNRVLKFINEVHGKEKLSEAINLSILAILKYKPENAIEDLKYQLYLPGAPVSILDTVIGDAIFFDSDDINNCSYHCIVKVKYNENDDTCSHHVMSIPLSWINILADPDKCKRNIMMDICYTLKSELELLESEISHGDANITNALSLIHNCLLLSGNIENEYTRGVINRLILLYNSINNETLCEEDYMSIYDISSAIEDFYPGNKISQKIVAELSSLELGNTNHCVEQKDDIIYISNLVGINNYDDKIMEPITLEVPANLYLKNDDEIKDYFIKYRLRELNKIIVGCQVRLQNTLTKYQEYDDEFEPIYSLFDISDLSRRVGEYGSK